MTKAGTLREKERGSEMLEEMQYSAFTDIVALDLDTPVTFIYMYVVHITARTSFYYATLLSNVPLVTSIFRA